MKTATVRNLSLLGLLAGLLTLANPLFAQGMGGGKDKGPIYHAAFFGVNEASTTGPVEALVLGPLVPGVTLEIFSITWLNVNQTPMRIQMRAILPDEEPVTRADCRDAGPALVVDEISRVVVPGYNSFQQTFPEGLEVPGYFTGDAPYLEPGFEIESNWCVIAFVSGLSAVDDAYEGRLTFRMNEPE
jgi:hypothetical protein